MEEKKVRIQDDLYQYVNGEWLEKAVIPADKPCTGGFMDVDQEVEKALMQDFREMAENKQQIPNELIHNAIRLYNKILDTASRNSLGMKPLMSYLNKIKELKNIDDLNENIYEFKMNSMPLPFRMTVSPDMQNTMINSICILGVPTILPDKPYYAPDNEQGKALIEVWKKMINSLLEETDLTEEERNLYIADAIAFDKKASELVKSQEEWSEYVKCYNPTPIDTVSEKMGEFNFKKLLSAFYDKLPETIIVYEPRFFDGFKELFNSNSFNQYKHWAYIMCILRNTAYLSEEIRKKGFAYRQALSGVAEQESMEKFAYKTAGGYFDEPIGIFYGKKYFGEKAKEDVTDICNQIIKTYIHRVKNNEFLEEATKEKAIVKLEKIGIKVGYPDKIDDIFDKMIVDENKSLIDNIITLNGIASKHNLEKLYKPIDRSEWPMPAHMVNAGYNPSFNDITFPAAILQAPFYSIKQSRSVNLGGIGAVIGHEITHAFDNNGANFDENGNLCNWWTEKDMNEFKKRTDLMADQYDGIQVGAGKVNGKLVVSENIADNGGMAVTLEIMNGMKDADFKGYFMNWAKVWCMKAKDEYTQLLLSVDVHSPNCLRANMTPRNFDEWYTAFGVTDKDKMYIAPEKRIHIW